MWEGTRRAGDDQIKEGIEGRGREKENKIRGWDDSDDDANSIADRPLLRGWIRVERESAMKKMNHEFLRGKILEHVNG